MSGLKYSSTMPGGYAAMSCMLNVAPDYRTEALNLGRQVQIVRGASVIWTGKLDEPQQSAAGWAISAHGAGTFGTEWDAVYTTWSNQNDAVNQAITRGLPWVNPGGNSIPSSVWVGQQQDSGSLTIADLLNLMTSKGAMVWQVGRGAVLSVTPIPAAVTRLLVCTTPAPRTLAGDINAIALRYQTSPDGAAVATFAQTWATSPASIAQHGRIETYDDLSSAGVLTAGQAQAVGSAVLAKYVRASFAGPFTVSYGQLLTTGGQPVDLGCETAGSVCQLILTDGGYGGEVTPGPVNFPVGAVEYDDDSDVLTVTPFQNVNMSLSGLLGAAALTGGTAGFERRAIAEAARDEAAADRRQEARRDRRQEARTDRRQHRRHRRG